MARRRLTVVARARRTRARRDVHHMRQRGSRGGRYRAIAPPTARARADGLHRARHGTHRGCAGGRAVETGHAPSPDAIANRIPSPPGGRARDGVRGRLRNRRARRAVDRVSCGCRRRDRDTVLAPAVRGRAVGTAPVVGRRTYGARVDRAARGDCARRRAGAVDSARRRSSPLRQDTPPVARLTTGTTASPGNVVHCPYLDSMSAPRANARGARARTNSWPEVSVMRRLFRHTLLGAAVLTCVDASRASATCLVFGACTYDFQPFVQNAYT